MKISSKIALAAASIAAAPLPLPLGHSDAAQAQNYDRGDGGRAVVRERSRQSINEEDYQRGDFRRNRDGGYQEGDGCYGYGCDWDEDEDHHVGAALAAGAVARTPVTATANNKHDDKATVVYSPAASTPTGAPALGTVVSGLPGGCSESTVDGYTYQECGSVWFQPHFVGSTLQYTVVAAPR